MAKIEKRILRNSIWNTLSLLGAIVINFFSIPILLQQLGSEEYGLMILLVSVTAPLGLMDFGMGDATVKYLAESLGKSDHAEVEQYVQSSMLFNLSIGLTGGIVIALLAHFLVTSVFNISVDKILLSVKCVYWIGALWCLTQIRQTFLGVVTAVKRYDLLSVGMMTSQFLVVGAGIAVLFAGGGLLGFIIAQVLTTALTAAGWFAVSRKLLPRVALIPAFHRRTLSRTSSFGFWQMLNNLGGVFTQQSQRWLLGVMLPMATVGFFNVSLQLANMVYMVTYKVGQVLFPEISELHGQKKGEEAANLVVNSMWTLSLGSVGLFVPMVVFARDILYLWVGSDISANTFSVLRILCIGTAIGSLFAIPSFYLLGTGRGRWLAGMSFIQGLSTIVITAILIPHFGIEGAGWGFTASTIVHLSILALMWKRIFCVWMSGSVYFSALVGPLIVCGVLSTAGLVIRDTIGGVFPWGVIVSIGICLVMISWGSALALNVVLPGGKNRLDFLRLLFSKMS